MKMTINGVELESNDPKEIAGVLMAMGNQTTGVATKKKGGWASKRWTKEEISFVRDNMEITVPAIIKGLKTIGGVKRTKPAVYALMSAIRTKKI